jgi:hypothetical protein
MSIAATNWAWGRPTRTSAQKLVLLCLAHFVDHRSAVPAAFPAIASICRQTNRSERSVQGALRALEAMGEIKVDGGRSPGRRTTRYILAFSPAENTELADCQAISTPQSASPNPAILDVQPRKSCTQTLREPKKEPEEERESARASPTSPDLIQTDEQVEGRSPEPSAATPPTQPAEARPSERPVADAGPTPPRKVLGNTTPDERRPVAAPPPNGPLPDDWSPRPDDLAFARSRGLDPEEMVLAFAAHYRGTGQCRANWSQVFRSWCIREPKLHRAHTPTRAERELANVHALQARAANLTARGFAGLPKGVTTWGPAP